MRRAMAKNGRPGSAMPDREAGARYRTELAQQRGQSVAANEPADAEFDALEAAKPLAANKQLHDNAEYFGRGAKYGYQVDFGALGDTEAKSNLNRFFDDVRGRGQNEADEQAMHRKRPFSRSRGAGGHDGLCCRQ